MRRILTCLLFVSSCTRAPVVASDGGLPPTEDLVRTLPEGPTPVGAPDLRVPDRLRVPDHRHHGPGCLPGDRMWCDGLMYSGWGHVACDPATGKWKTKVHNGKQILDCQELASGGRPNTLCACYHAYYNPSCCEEPDCFVPPGSNGQICPPSPGKLCDYCSPQKPECTEAKAKCVVTNSHETFCGRLCSATEPCPAGYQCMAVKLAGGAVTYQCVPSDFSCYY